MFYIAIRNLLFIPFLRGRKKEPRAFPWEKMYQKSNSGGKSFAPKSKSGGSYWISGREQRPGFRSKPRFAPRRNNKRSFGEEIDISRFIQKSTSAAPVVDEIVDKTFADFNFCEAINKNLAYRKFVTPTPIQAKAIEHVMAGRDIIGLASTGTGKTAAFLLPMIEKVRNDRSQFVLIIAPTRELAQQIESEFRQFSWGMQIFSANCVGGAPIFKQISNLKRNPNFVIGTPGRLKDLSDRGLVKFGNFQTIVLDEVDRMLDMGFVDEIKAILGALPTPRQSLFFSATMPMKIRDLVNRFSNNPVTIETKVGQASANVSQDIIKIRDKALKFNQLKELLATSEITKALIFIETKAEVERVTSNLVYEGFKADSLHGDKKQSQRQRALSRFKENSVNILVATDVAARGLDINGISHVINYTIPQTYDDYIHRIGRTGRGQNKGFAYTFVE